MKKDTNKSEIRTFFEKCDRRYQVIAENHEHFVEFLIFDEIDDKWMNDYAEPIISGSIKWDGCSNWDFSKQYHFCSKTDAKNFGDLLPKLYEWASELMPENKENLED